MELNGKLKLVMELARLIAWLDDNGRECQGCGVRATLARVIGDIKSE